MSGIRLPTWHRGDQRIVVAANPGVAREWAIQVPTVPEGVWWELISVMFQTATDANVGGRNIGVRILTTRSDVAPGGQGVTDSCYCDIRPNNTVAANLIQPWTAYQGSTIVGPSGGLRASLPFNLRIQPGHWIQSSTLSFSGAGDEYSGIRLLVQEWIYEL